MQMTLQKSLIKMHYEAANTIQTIIGRIFNLQVQWMCMNSIVLYYSFGIKVQQSSFSLFKRCNGVILCSKTSVCRCNVHSLIKNFAMFLEDHQRSALVFVY